METLIKIGAVTCVAFIFLAGISLVLPHINEMYQPLYGTDSGVIGYTPPSREHILGTDFMGRDIFSQLCAGAFNALVQGVLQTVVPFLTLLVIALLLSRIRLETPSFDDTLFTKYVRFIAFPLGVIALLSFLIFLIGPLLVRSFWAYFLFSALGFSYLGWLAVGCDIETQFRNRKIPVRLFISFITLVMSYLVLYDGVLGFFGFGSPSMVTWGIMVQWCYTSGYTFEALHWLLPPIICMYALSRGMLAISYSLYKSAKISD
ncbi:MAG: hypothetical protein HXS54_06450 [Theionarchaea archaeon]|nr:hypothetical protein [Theionarchaea archaeon]